MTLPGVVRPPTGSWVLAVWTFVGCEMLLLLYLVAARPPEKAEPFAGVAERELVLGVDGEHGGVLRPLLVVNAVVATGLWTAFRSLWRFGTPWTRALAAMALGAAVLLAALSYLAVRIAEEQPVPPTLERIELAPDGAVAASDRPAPGAFLELTSSNGDLAGPSAPAPAP